MVNIDEMDGNGPTVMSQLADESDVSKKGISDLFSSGQHDYASSRTNSTNVSIVSTSAFLSLTKFFSKPPAPLA